MTPRLIPAPRRLRLLNGATRLDAQTPVTVQPDASLPPEGYTLAVENQRVLITAATPAGEFYARQTLAQLIAGGDGICENLIIKDAPVLPYRSFMIDCCRHFYGVDVLKTLIDAAAGLKLNTFHWHLTDDQGWRVEIKRYPLLTEIGSVRPRSHFGGVVEPEPHSGFFTQAEIREIVAYCAARQIEVVPEFELPGHFTAALAAYPALGCSGRQFAVEQMEGVFPNVLCVGQPAGLAFVKDVLDELCSLFPGRYFHIGGDEAPRRAWQACPHCRAQMAARGLKSFDALQGDFMKQVAAYLKEKGKTAITWNESLKGGQLAAEDVIVQRWMERRPLTRAFAKAGGRVIESDFYHYYCDYPYGMTPLKKSFAYDPYRRYRGTDALLGVEGNLWTEYVRSFEDLCQKLFPRLLAVAEHGWSGPPAGGYRAFRARVEALRPLLEAQGIALLPAERWDLPPTRRLPDIWRFFRGSLRQALQKKPADQ